VIHVPFLALAPAIKWELPAVTQRSFDLCVMAGLVPATPIEDARPCQMIGVAGSSPAMTRMGGLAGD
jgi:hypothetical protein